MPEEGASFEDRVLLLLAAVARSEGMLTYPEYEATATLVRSIFGEKALGASFQARFHYALLHPAARPDELAASLAREAVDEKVSGEQISALLRGLDGLHARREHGVSVWDMSRRLRETINIAFEEERLAVRRRHLAEEGGVVHSLEQGARLGVQAGKFAVDGTVQLVQGDGRHCPEASAPSGEGRRGLPPSVAGNGILQPAHGGGGFGTGPGRLGSG